MALVRNATSERNVERSSARRDAWVVALITLCGGLLSVGLELSEWVFAWTRRWERWQLDELSVVLFILSAGLAWFASRRYRDARVELARRRAAEEQLERLLLDNRRLAQQHLQAQETERKALARELHDELGQYLNAIKIDAVAIHERASDGASPVLRAASIIQHTDHVYAVVRDLIRKLRPTGLDELGLTAALDHYVNDWRRRLPEVQFQLSLEGDLDSLGEPLALAVYRLVQEGLTNVSRHARAKHVEIGVRRFSGDQQHDEVVFSIADDGCGADLSAKHSGLGLLGMHERVELLGGRSRVVAAPGQGFRFLAHIPALDFVA